MVTARQRADNARAGPENRPAASGGSVAPIWVLNCVLALAAGVVYVLGIAPLPHGSAAPILVIAALAASFAAGEWWRVFIHFRQEAQSFSLSEIPLVIGIFVLAGDPGPLVLARVLGAGIGLGLLRRQDPMKLIFNLASFALETETVTILVHHISRHRPDRAWSTGSGCCSSCPPHRCWVFALTVLAISLAEGRQSRHQWVQPTVIVLVGGFANCSLGLVVVARCSSARSGGAAGFCVTPLAAIWASYVLYTREHQKHQRLQYLYESSDMLQRASSDGAAIPELLDQLCKVFRADIATVCLLPVATGTGSWRTISNSRGSSDNFDSALSTDLLERFVPLLDETKRGLIVTQSTSDPELRNGSPRRGTATPWRRCCRARACCWGRWLSPTV